MTLEVRCIWKDGTVWILDEVNTLNFAYGANMAGNFRLNVPFSKYTANVLVGSEFYIYQDDHRVFGGILDDKEFDADTVTFYGVDFNGMFQRRKIEYKFMLSTPCSEAIQTLASVYTEGIDYDKYVYPCLTSIKWEFKGKSLFDCWVQIARASRSTLGTWGYIVYVDPYKYLHYEPKGASVYRGRLPLVNIKTRFATGDIKNKVYYYGMSDAQGNLKQIPCEGDNWTENSAQFWLAEICTNGCETTCQGCEQTTCETYCEVTACQTCVQGATCQTCDEITACQQCGQTGFCEDLCEAGCA